MVCLLLLFRPFRIKYNKRFASRKLRQININCYKNPYIYFRKKVATQCCKNVVDINENISRVVCSKLCFKLRTHKRLADARYRKPHNQRAVFKKNIPMRLRSDNAVAARLRTCRQAFYHLIRLHFPHRHKTVFMFSSDSLNFVTIFG